MLNKKDELHLMNCKQLAEMLGISKQFIAIGDISNSPKMYREIGKKSIFIYEEVEKFLMVQT